MEKIKITVLEDNLDRFKKSVSKLVKMYNFQGVSFKISDGSPKIVEYEYLDYKRNTRIKKLKAIEYIISYDQITVDNRYSVIGILEKNDKKIVINFLEKGWGSKLDKKLLQEDLFCDHCSTNRKRKQVFLVLDNKTNKIVRLGKACLQSYIPKSVDSVINLIRYSELFLEGDWGSTNNAMNLPELLNFKRYVISCLHFLETEGYVSRNSTMDVEKQTRTLAKRYMYSDDYVDNNDLYIKYLTFIRDCKSIDYALLSNIKVFHSEKYFRENFDERILYTCFKYLNSIEETEPKKELNQLEVKHASEFVGVVGNKIRLTDLEYVKSDSFENKFSYYGGLSFIHTFKDIKANIFIYMGSLSELDVFKLEEEYNEYCFNVSEISPSDYLKLFKYDTDCKIKKHENYNGVNQTYIKNIKLIDKRGF